MPRAGAGKVTSVSEMCYVLSLSQGVEERNHLRHSPPLTHSHTHHLGLTHTLSLSHTHREPQGSLGQTLKTLTG